MDQRTFQLTPLMLQPEICQSSPVLPQLPILVVMVSRFNFSFQALNHRYKVYD